MSCIVCGNPLKSDERFCSICGAENTETLNPEAAGQNVSKAASANVSPNDKDSDDEFVWNIYEFPKPKKTEDIDFKWTTDVLEAEIPEEKNNAAVQEEAERTEKNSTNDPQVDRSDRITFDLESTVRPETSDDLHRESSTDRINSYFTESAESLGGNLIRDRHGIRRAETGNGGDSQIGSDHLEVGEDVQEKSEKSSSKYVNIYKNSLIFDSPEGEDQAAKAEKSKIKEEGIYKASELVFELEEEEKAERIRQETLRNFQMMGNRNTITMEAAPESAVEGIKNKPAAPDVSPKKDSGNGRAPEKTEITITNEKDQESSPQSPESPKPKTFPSPFDDNIPDSLYEKKVDDDEVDTSSLEEFLFGSRFFRETKKDSKRRITGAIPQDIAEEAAGQKAENIYKGQSPEGMAGGHVTAKTAGGPLESGTAAKPTGEGKQPVQSSLNSPTEAFSLTDQPDLLHPTGPVQESDAIDLEKTKPFFRKLFDRKATEKTIVINKPPEPQSAAGQEKPEERSKVVETASNIGLGSPGSERAATPSGTREAQLPGLSKPEIAAGIAANGVSSAAQTSVNAAASAGLAGRPGAGLNKGRTDGSTSKNTSGEITGEERSLDDFNTKALEREIFHKMEEDAKNRGDDVDKFFTFSKKNEDFQKLLDQEYEKIKEINADRPQTPDKILNVPDILPEAPLHKEMSRGNAGANGISNAGKDAGAVAPEQHHKEQVDTQREAAQRKAEHLAEMEKARESFFMDQQEDDDSDRGIKKRIKLRSKGPAEVHVTVEVKADSIEQQETFEQIAERSERTEQRYNEKHQRLEKTEAKASGNQAAGMSAPVSTNSVVPGKAAKSENEEEMLPPLSGSDAISFDLGSLSKNTASEKIESLGSLNLQTKSSEKTPPKQSQAAPKQESVDESAGLWNASATTSKEPVSSETDTKKVEKAQSAPVAGKNGSETDQAVLNPWSYQKAKKEKVKSALAVRILVGIIGIVLIVLSVALAIKFAAPNSIAYQRIEAIQYSIVDGVKSVFGGFFGGGDEEEPDEGKGEEPEDLGEGQAEPPVPDPVPAADKTTIIAEMLTNNPMIVTKIRAVMKDDALVFDANMNYSNTLLKESQPIENNIWTATEDNRPVYYDESVIKTVTMYNARWIDFVNEGDPTIYEFILENSQAYRFVAGYSKPAGLTNKAFDMLYFGEIRQNGDNFFVMVHEEILDTVNGTETRRVLDYIYHLQISNGTMKVAEQIPI